MKKILKYVIVAILVEHSLNVAYCLENDSVVLVFTGPKNYYDNPRTRYENDNCEKIAARNIGACGVIFEKKECDDGGWFNWFGQADQKTIENDTWVDLRGTGLFKDIKSAIVAPGCVMFGYEKNDKIYRGRELFRLDSTGGYKDWFYKDVSVRIQSNGKVFFHNTRHIIMKNSRIIIVFFISNGIYEIWLFMYRK